MSIKGGAQFKTLLDSGGILVGIQGGAILVELESPDGDTMSRIFDPLDAVEIAEALLKAARSGVRDRAAWSFRPARWAELAPQKAGDQA